VTPTPYLSLGLLLTAAAGMIDVVGFIELGGFYTSFMSGNTTRGAVDSAQGGAWWIALGLVAAGSVALLGLGLKTYRRGEATA